MKHTTIYIVTCPADAEYSRAFSSLDLAATYINNIQRDMQAYGKDAVEILNEMKERAGKYSFLYVSKEVICFVTKLNDTEI